MPSLSSLNTPHTGLNAQRRALDVIAHNVANARTEGYHRQRVEIGSLGTTATTGVFSGASRTYGADVVSVTRAYDEVLASRAIREDATRQSAASMRTAMTTVESIFPEPTDLGLSAVLDTFWGSWTDLANDPGSLAARSQVLENARWLATSLNRTDSQLQAVATDAATRIGGLAVEVNDLAAQIADLNRTITSSSPPNNDLLDRRDVLAGRLANLTGATVRPTTGGKVDVLLGGRALVMDTSVQTVTGSTGVLQWTSDSAAVNPASGEAHGLASVIADVVPRYRAMLDGVASQLVTSVNALHTAGYDQAGTTGRNFFDPANLTAGTIRLSADVLGQPANVAAGAPVLPGPVAPGPLDGEQARRIAALAESASGADAQYQSLVTTLSLETRAARSRFDIQEQVADTAMRDAASVGSVSIDEEMVALTMAQRAYEANARVMTAIDEMLGFLIERTGVVGR